MRALILSLALLPVAATAQTPHETYVLQCAQDIGPVPAFSCASGEIVPVIQEGTVITYDNFVDGQTCDRPALLDNGNGDVGQCVPNSRILDLSTDTMQVAVMCRQKQPREQSSMLFDEIDVIAHNPKTGATCWWAAKTDDGTPVDGSAVPAPTDATADYPWIDPEGLWSEGCGTCHDNDPFMYSPFVGQVWSIVPENPFGAYYHVDPTGVFADWPTQYMDPDDSTCTSCHRIGLDKTCGELTTWMTGGAHTGQDGLAQQFPLSHGMPPAHGMTIEQWTTIYGPAVADIQSCCLTNDQPMCNITDLPAYPPAQ